MRLQGIFSLTASAAILVSCTESGNIRFAQQLEIFDANQTQDVNTKLDILWVIDNSGSMEDNQQKVRAGLVSFASKYMKPTWDIRSAVITTDVFLSHPSFHTYLNVTPISGTANYAPPYLNGIPT